MEKHEHKVVKNFVSTIQDMFKNKWQVFEEDVDKFATVRSATLESIPVIVTFYNCGDWDYGGINGSNMKDVFFILVCTPCSSCLTVSTPVMDKCWNIYIQAQHREDGVVMCIPVYTPRCGWCTVFTPVMDRCWSICFKPRHREDQVNM